MIRSLISAAAIIVLLVTVRIAYEISHAEAQTAPPFNTTIPECQRHISIPGAPDGYSGHKMAMVESAEVNPANPLFTFGGAAPGDLEATVRVTVLVYSRADVADNITATSDDLFLNWINGPCEQEIEALAIDSDNGAILLDYKAPIGVLP